MNYRRWVKALAGIPTTGASALTQRSWPSALPHLPAIIKIPMKARVFVSLKSTVLDPQGQTIRSALNGLGHHSIADVRQGKFFDIAISDAVTPEQARTEVET